MRFIKKIAKKVAQPPGTLIHVGEKKSETVKLTQIRYNKDMYEEKEMESPCQCFAEKDVKGVCWLNVTGIHDTGIIEEVGNHFGLHPLIMEDILNTLHRPKYEYLEDYIFIVIKMLYYDKVEQAVLSEHVSVILGPDFVVTFQERENDVFAPVRQRIRKAKGSIRKNGADYLLYTLIDAIVDNYFLVLENMGEEIETLEDRLLENPEPGTLEIVHKLKRDMIFLRKAVWPLREIVNGLLKDESRLIKKTTGIYLRDVYDHTIQVIETVETYRDMAAGLHDLYLSSVSNKMNEVMKVLTIIATIFIPLTFIAGVYGMNFDFMPELKWKAGYFIVWGLMAAVAAVMYIFFKRKKWF